MKTIFPKSNLILLDDKSAIDATILNLNVMKDMHVPGGKGENYLKKLEGCSHETPED